MPLSCYSQSLDSLPIKELNNEFLKGISARERLHQLKKVSKLDSIQLSLYKDSLLPSYDVQMKECRKEIYYLMDTIEQKNNLIKIYRYSCLVLAALTVGLLF